MAKRNDILAWCDEVLQVGMFKDYAPNGLQVEGRAEVDKIATSVTANTYDEYITRRNVLVEGLNKIKGAYLPAGQAHHLQ